MNNIIKYCKNINSFDCEFDKFLSNFDLFYDFGDFNNAVRFLKLFTSHCSHIHLNTILDLQILNYIEGKILSDFKIFYLIKCCEFLNKNPEKKFKSLAQKDAFDDIALKEFNERKKILNKNFFSNAQKVEFFLELNINFPF